MRVERLSSDRWDAALPGRGVEPFHAAAALDAIERHAPGELRRYAAIEDDDLIGLLPAFVRTESLGTAVQSPPSGLGIPRLGPVVPAADGTDRSDRNYRFVEAIAATVGADAPLTMFRTCCPAGYDDPRPFHWADLTPEFVHRVPLRDAVREIRRSSDEVDDGPSIDDPVDHELPADGLIERTSGDPDAARSAASLNGGLPDPDLVADIVEALGDRARTYRAVIDGVPRAAAVVLFGTGSACCWFSTGSEATGPKMTGSAGFTGSTWTTDEPTETDVRSLVEQRAIVDAAIDPAYGAPRYLDFPGRQVPADGSFETILRPYYIVESPGKYVEAAPAAERGLY